MEASQGHQARLLLDSCLLIPPSPTVLAARSPPGHRSRCTYFPPASLAPSSKSPHGGWGQRGQGGPFSPLPALRSRPPGVHLLPTQWLGACERWERTLDARLRVWQTRGPMHVPMFLDCRWERYLPPESGRPCRALKSLLPQVVAFQPFGFRSPVEGSKTWRSSVFSSLAKFGFRIYSQRIPQIGEGSEEKGRCRHPPKKTAHRVVPRLRGLGGAGRRRTRATCKEIRAEKTNTRRK